MILCLYVSVYIHCDINTRSQFVVCQTFAMEKFFKQILYCTFIKLYIWTWRIFYCCQIPMNFISFGVYIIIRKSFLTLGLFENTLMPCSRIFMPLILVFKYLILWYLFWCKEVSSCFLWWLPAVCFKSNAFFYLMLLLSNAFSYWWGVILCTDLIIHVTITNCF